MVTLINLIGEQPIPNLLPVLFLKPDKTIMLYTDTTERTAQRIKKLVDSSELKKIDPYDIKTSIDLIKTLTESNENIIYNITGGTKIMSLAAYQVAFERQGKFVYLQSEGNRNILHSYHYSSGVVSDPIDEVIPELIDVDYYLRAHLPAYNREGFHTDVNTRQLSDGGKFEKTIYDLLNANTFEVISGIRPLGVGNQIEIDLALRLQGTNNVGIAELKLGDKSGEGPKKGLDQLVMAAEREYLGTYTTRFLITARPLSRQIKELAISHKITVIDDLEYNFRNSVLSEQSKSKILQKIKEKLS